MAGIASDVARLSVSSREEEPFNALASAVFQNFVCSVASRYHPVASIHVHNKRRYPVLPSGCAPTTLALLERWLGGSAEPTILERDLCIHFQQSLLHTVWEELVDYDQLDRFAFHNFSQDDQSSMHLPAGLVPEFIVHGGYYEVVQRDTYAWAYDLKIVKIGGSVAKFLPSSDERRIQCPSHKTWAIAHSTWTLVSGPEGDSPTTGSAGVELMVGFISHVGKSGYPVSIAKDGTTQEEIHSTHFELLGIAAFSADCAIGCDFYKFSIDNHGVVSGYTLGQPGEVEWACPVSGRAVEMPSYCKVKLVDPNEALQLIEKATNAAELKQAFGAIQELVVAGKVPDLMVTDIIRVAKNVRHDRLSNEWDTDVAKVFGLLLKSAKSVRKQQQSVPGGSTLRQ